MTEPESPQTRQTTRPGPAQPLSPEDCRRKLDFIKRNFRAGRFNHELLATAQTLLTNLEQLQDGAGELSYDYIQGAGYCLEVLDYFGLWEKAAEQAQVFESRYSHLRTNRAKRDEIGEPRLLREIIRLILICSISKYRQHRYGEMPDLCHDLNEILHREIVPEGLPCLGTQAKINYFLSRLLRQFGRFRESEESLKQAITLYHRRIELKTSDPKLSPEERKAEALFCNYRIAILTGLGLSWLRMNYGTLSTSQTSLEIARSWLATTEDELNKAYCDFMLGAVRFRLHARDPEQIRGALAHLRGAAEVFEKYKHRPYLVRCSYEMAVAHYYLEEDEDARGLLLEIEGTRDPRRQAQIRMLQSRIAVRQKNFTAAVRFAAQAIDCLRGPEPHGAQPLQSPLLVEALIIRAEAEIAGEQYAGAAADLQRAQELNRQPSFNPHYDLVPDLRINPRNEALIVLNRARLLACQRHRSEALVCFQQWDEEFRGIIDHGRIIELAESVRAEIGRLTEEFFIPRPDPDDEQTWKVLDYETQHRNLKRFLLAEAEHLAKRKQRNTRQQLATYLGIPQSTLFSWLSQLNRPQPETGSEEQQPGPGAEGET